MRTEVQHLMGCIQMSENFTFDVAYDTSFEAIERLRDKMLQFVKSERRDYQPAFDIQVVDFPEQDKMTLTAEIKYKTNGQLEGLKGTEQCLQLPGNMC